MASIGLSTGGTKTDLAFWDSAPWPVPSSRFWAPFDATALDVHALLRRHVPHGAKLIELGFAPGKLLAWAAIKLHAKVSGIDYSPNGVATAHRYFYRLGISGDFRTEDLFATSFRPGSFDCVTSWGLVEHFDDARPVVARHVELCRPGGKIIIGVPNYGGALGRIQGWIDPENLAIHNLGIMTPRTLADLFDPADVSELAAHRMGRPSLWGLSLARAMPPKLALAVQAAAGAAGHLFPFKVPFLAPWVVAVATKRE